ncbi:MAG: sensor histidine kinase [Lachnospiraceae bacterium]
MDKPILFFSLFYFHSISFLFMLKYAKSINDGGKSCMKHIIIQIQHSFYTIRGRILLCTISLIVIISTIIMLISYYLVFSSLQENMLQTSETKLTFLCASINSNISTVQEFIRSCQYSSKVKDFALESDTNHNIKKRIAHDFVSETYNSNIMLRSELIRLVIVGKQRNDIIQVVESPYSTVTVSADAILALPYFEQLCNNQGEVSTGILLDPFITRKEVWMIPFVNTITHPYKADDIGYIFTEMSTSVFTEPIENYRPETNSMFLFQIGGQQYQYVDNKLVKSSYLFETLEQLSVQAFNPETVIQKSKDLETGDIYFLISRYLDIDGWYVTECFNSSVLYTHVTQTFLLIAVVTLLVTTLIGIGLSYFLSHTVNKPVQQLQSRMKQISNGDFRRDPTIEWNHELGEIGKGINDLSENIQKLLHQRIADEREKRDYEYKMLQSQINPHFLYNTLNSIKWMATIQNAPGIAEMTTALSRLLRDISKGTTSLITIEHEISLINDYFTIQQYRYGGAITLSFDIEDESLKNCQILKFTLQPIVENAIFHGIEPKGNAGHIEIHIYQDKTGDVIIDVTDNGIGMDKHTSEVLLKNETSKTSSFFQEIGVSNVHKRLQYEFGTGYGLSVKSEPGIFTTISIRLPFHNIFKEEKFR